MQLEFYAMGKTLADAKQQKVHAKIVGHGYDSKEEKLVDTTIECCKVKARQHYLHLVNSVHDNDCLHKMKLEDFKKNGCKRCFKAIDGIVDEMDEVYDE